MKVVKLGQVLRAAAHESPEAVSQDMGKLERMSSLAAQLSKQKREVEKIATAEHVTEEKRQMVTAWLATVTAHLNRLNAVVMNMKTKATEVARAKLEERVKSVKIISKGSEDGRCWKEGLRQDCEYQELLEKSDSLLAPSMARRLQSAFSELIKDSSTEWGKGSRQMKL